MHFIGDFVCKHKKIIVILCLIMMIPAFIGMEKTKINYDILVYLPEDIETIKGENILTNDFKMGAFAIAITENMADKDILKFEEKIKDIDGVSEVISINDFTGTTIPVDFLPKEITSKVVKGDSKLLLITFEDSTSADRTLDAVAALRKMVDDKTQIGGMSAMVLDTKELFNSEMALYVIIAVILCVVVLMLSLDSYIVPLLLIANIGVAILFNMGSNIFLGDICYITKAISAVLQLGVTTDFSIFLYHKYERAKKENKDINKAMSSAIHETLISVFGSSLTTIAGFLALCTMNLTLGTDIGIVMAKGVVFGLICVIILFPALLLLFDKLIDKTKHKVILPKFTFIKNFTLKHYKLIFVLFLVLLVPTFLAQTKTPVYYKLDSSIPDNYGYTIATKTLKDNYNIVSQELILVSSDLSSAKLNMMTSEIKNIEGVDLVLSSSMLTDYGLSEDILTDKIKKIYETDKYKMIIINSVYEIATDELNEQISEITNVVKKYDENAIVAGEGPLMKDLVEITDQDFKNVNYTSIIVIFVLMLLVLKSISLPVLLVSSIEFAIFINMGIPYFTGTEIPFIASVVIGTIQLGATIDYAILITTKYLDERKSGKDKKEAVSTALDSSIGSIFVSGMCFFAATIGVGIVSKIDMIGSLCTLISRGAIISMIVVMTIVPSIILIFDGLIVKTTFGFKNKKKGNKNMKRNNKMSKKLAILLLTFTFGINTLNVSANTKEETVYAKLDENGKNIYTTVVEHIINDEKLDEIRDKSRLENIENTNGEETYEVIDDHIYWKANGKDIYYKGTTDKELPISLNVTYKLDGKEMKVSDMLGKSGNVEITLKFKNNNKQNVIIDDNEYEMYTPFMVAVTTYFNEKTTSDLKVTNGKVVSNGQNYVLAAVAAPGLYESMNLNELKDLDTIKINYNTTSFELNSIYSAVTAELVDMSDLHMFEKLDSLYEKVDTLQYSSHQLVSGTSQVNDGAKAIRNGVVNAINELKNNNETIDNQTLNYISEKAKLEAQKSIEAQKEAIMKKAIAEFDQKENATHAIKEASDMGVDSNATLISSLKNTAHQMLMADPQGKAALEACQAGMKDYCSVVEQTENKVISTAKASFYENALTLGRSVAAETAYNSALSTAVTVAGGISSATATTVADNTKSTIINKVVTSLNTLVGGLDSLLEGTNALANGMYEFNNQGIDRVANFVNDDLKLNAKKIEELTKLASAYKNFGRMSSSMNGKTKFILLIDAQKDEKVKTTKVKEEKKNESIIDKVVGLFR